ncbi:MAG: sugar-binding domain-containing protein [Bacteroidota bacterium]
MINKILLILFLLFTRGSLLAQYPPGYTETNRQKININQDWKFSLGEQSSEVNTKGFDDSGWAQINVPHTFELASLDLNGSQDDPYQETFQRNIGWYRKKLNISVQKRQKVFLEFEGAHQVTSLWVNGEYVGKHDVGGYTPFHFDVTSFVKPGENTIALKVDNTLNPEIPPEGDQYDYIKFSGLYRDVYLVTTDELYVPFAWEEKESGVFITTPTVTPENATIHIRTTVRNASEEEKECKLLTRIIDQQGQVVARMESSQMILPQSAHTFSQITGITENLQLWSPVHPYLYRVNTLVMNGDEAVDQVENPLGIRKIELIDGEGLRLNGEPLELIGANRHQAYPFVGDAVPNSLHWKDAYQFKQAGFNVVRLAHYPHDNSFLEACDELGLLVYEEPPTWIGIGNEVWFDRLEEATRRMIRNHRNHPSVFTWGAAINHRGPVERLHYAAKEEDPTRPTSSNGSPWTGPRSSGICDIYAPMDYQDMPITDRELSFLCEHGSSANAIRNQVEVSRSKVSPNRIGVAVWTAHDYQTFKPRDLFASRRIFSFYRVPNPVFYWYQSELLPEPMVYIADLRASSSPREVIVFSNCQEVALYNNGKLVARQVPDRDPERLHVDHPSFSFALPSVKGNLEAKGFVNGREVASHHRSKVGRATQLRVVIEEDERPFFASGFDIKMVRAYLQDDQGNTVLTDTSEVEFSVEGPGTIVGDASVDANPNPAYYGVSSALLKSGSATGKITVIARAKGLKKGSASITTVAYEPNRTLAEAQPIYDLKEVKLDVGNDQQQLQFGWIAWNGNDENEESIQLKAWPEATVKISSQGKPIEWTDAWGMSSEKAYLAMDGVRIEQGGSLKVSFQDFPEGNYQGRLYLHNIGIEKNTEEASIRIRVGEEVLTEGIRPTTGQYLDQKPPTFVEVSFGSDGSSPVEITIEDISKSQEVILNGLIIREIRND